MFYRRQDSFVPSPGDCMKRFDRQRLQLIVAEAELLYDLSLQFDFLPEQQRQFDHVMSELAEFVLEQARYFSVAPPELLEVMRQSEVCRVALRQKMFLSRITIMDDPTLITIHRELKKLDAENFEENDR